MTEASDLFAELEADQQGASGTCTMAALLDEMTPDDRAQWDAAFRNLAYTATSIHRALQRRGFNIGDQPVQRHARRIRKGQGCQCPRS